MTERKMIHVKWSADVCEGDMLGESPLACAIADDFVAWNKSNAVGGCPDELAVRLTELEAATRGSPHRKVSP